MCQDEWLLFCEISLPVPLRLDGCITFHTAENIIQPAAVALLNQQIFLVIRPYSGSAFSLLLLHVWVWHLRSISEELLTTLLCCISLHHCLSETQRENVHTAFLLSWTAIYYIIALLCNKPGACMSHTHPGHCSRWGLFTHTQVFPRTLGLTLSRSAWIDQWCSVSVVAMQFWRDYFCKPCSASVTSPQEDMDYRMGNCIGVARSQVTPLCISQILQLEGHNEIDWEEMQWVGRRSELVLWLPVQTEGGWGALFVLDGLTSGGYERKKRVILAVSSCTGVLGAWEKKRGKRKGNGRKKKGEGQ